MSATTAMSAAADTMSWWNSALIDCRTPKSRISSGKLKEQPGQPAGNFLVVEANAYYSPDNNLGGINCNRIPNVTPPFPELGIVGLFDTTLRSSNLALRRIAPLLALTALHLNEDDVLLMFALPTHQMSGVQSGRSAVFQWLKAIGHAPNSEVDLPIILGYNFSLEVRSHLFCPSDNDPSPASINNALALDIINHTASMLKVGKLEPRPHIFLKSYADASVSSPQFSLSSKLLTRQVMSAFVGWYHKQ